MPGRKRGLLGRLKAFHATAVTLRCGIGDVLPQQYRDVRNTKWPQAYLWLTIEEAATNLEGAIAELHDFVLDRLERSQSACVEAATEDAEADDPNGRPVEPVE